MAQLVEGRASLEATDYDGETALSLARQLGHEKVVLALLWQMMTR